MIENDPNIDTAVEAVDKIYNERLSQNSPFQVDISLILEDNLMDEDEKRFLDIKSFVTETTRYKNIIMDIFNEETGFEVKYEVVDNLTNDSGQSLNGLCIFDAASNNATIQINRSHINSDTKIEIASTIIHEALHAYMSYIISNDTSVEVPNGVNIEDLSECLELYLENYEGMDGTQSPQHQFMADEFIPVLIDVVLETLPLLYRQNILDQVEQEGDIRIVNNDENLEWVEGALPEEEQNPLTPGIDYYWNWHDFAYYFVVGDFKDTDFFQSTIAVIPSDTAVWDLTEEQIVNLEAVWLYYTYRLRVTQNSSNATPNLYQLLH